MIVRHNLLAGVALGGLALISAPASAKKPVHHKKPAAASSANTQLLEEIKALKEQVEDLSGRLAVQEATSRESVASINTAQTAAVTASSQAAAAQTAAAAAQTAAVDAKTSATKAVPAEVKTQLASYSKGKWWDSTSISGRMYFNFSTLDTKSNGVKATGAGSLNGVGFNIKRFYLGVDHTFSPIFSANLTMDASNVVGQTSNTNFTSTGSPAGSNLPALVGKGFYIKKAYLQAKLNPAFIIRLGAADLPWVPYDEGLYGYRHIENTLIDRTNFGTSADWGIHVLGDLAGGLLSYQVSVIDGGGYRNVKVTKSVDVEGRISTQYKGFYAGVGGYSGKRGNDTQGALLPNGGDLRTATRFDAMAGYKNAMFNIGAEYFWAKNWNNVTSNVEDKADGFSIYGNANFYKTWSVFGRYDHLRPSKEVGNATPELKDDYFNVGLQWEPVKIVDLALVYKRDKVKNGTFGTQNGTIGGANAAGLLTGGQGTYDEFGLFGQLRF